VTLLGDTTLTAAGGSLGAVTVAGVISSGTASHYALTVHSAGDILFAGGTSTVPANELGSIHAQSAGTTKFGNGTVSGTISVITTGTQQYDGAVELLGNTAFQGSGLTFNTMVVAATYDLTLISDAMTFAGGPLSVTGSLGHLTLRPLAADHNVLINSTGGTLPTRWCLMVTPCCRSPALRSRPSAGRTARARCR
jgi:hypothetical protein